MSIASAIEPNNLNLYAKFMYSDNNLVVDTETNEKPVAVDAAIFSKTYAASAEKRKLIINYTFTAPLTGTAARVFTLRQTTGGNATNVVLGSIAGAAGTTQVVNLVHVVNDAPTAATTYELLLTGGTLTIPGNIERTQTFRIV